MTPALLKRDPTDVGLSAPTEERHECTDGWLGDDDSRPCPVCRPHLSRQPITGGLGYAWHATARGRR